MTRPRVYLEPRDAWVGAYLARDALYVCPLPLLVLRWERPPGWPVVLPLADAWPSILPAKFRLAGRIRHGPQDF